MTDKKRGAERERESERQIRREEQRERERERERQRERQIRREEQKGKEFECRCNASKSQRTQLPSILTTTIWLVSYPSTS